jgi:hypothetical protein
MKRNQFVAPKNPGLIRCTNAGDVLKRHSQASFQMLFQNISPLGKPTATLCLSHFPIPIFSRKARKAGPLAERESDAISQSRASSLVKGFENAAPAQVTWASPCVLLLSVPILVIRGSKSTIPCKLACERI